MTATDRPLLLTRDPDLLDDLRRLSVAAGVEPDVVTTAAAGRRLWSAAPVVVVGDDLARRSCRPPSRVAPTWVLGSIIRAALSFFGLG